MKRKLYVLSLLSLFLLSYSACKPDAEEVEDKVSDIQVMLPDDLEEFDLDYENPSKTLDVEWTVESGVNYTLLFSLNESMSNPVSVPLNSNGKDKLSHDQLDDIMAELGVGIYKRAELYWVIQGSKGDIKVKSSPRSMLLWRFLNPFTDPRDGEVYRVCKVVDPLTGNYAIWMADNMRCKKYSDGTALDLYNDVRFVENTPDATEHEKEWNRLRGGFYTWRAAVRDVSAAINGEKVQGIAPDGWHIATKQEWTDLINLQEDNHNPATSLKDPDFWPSNAMDRGNNNAKFNMVPAGYIWQPVGSENGIIEETNAFFWMATIPVEGDVIPWNPPADQFHTQAYSYGFVPNDAGAALYVYDRERGYSVRCVLD